MANFTPEGCRRLDEVFDLLVKIKRGPTAEEQPLPADPTKSLSEDPKIQEWHKKYEEDLSNCEAQLKAALISGELGALGWNDKEKREYRILPREWEWALWPTSLFYFETPQEFHDSKFAKYNGKYAYVSKTALENWIEQKKLKSTACGFTNRKSSKKYSDGKVEAFFKRCIEKLKNSDYPPLERDDAALALAEFPGIGRDQIRKCRASAYPESWIKPGPRKTIGELKSAE